MAIIRIFACCLLLVLPSTLHATKRVFYDGFEDGSTNKWENPGTWPKAQATTTNPKFGSYCAVANWYGSIDYNKDGTPEAINDGIALLSWDYDNEIFIRMWIRLDEDVDHEDGPKWFRVGWNQTTTKQVTFIHDWGSDGNGHTRQVWYFGNDQGGNPISYVPYPTMNPVRDNNWHKVEIYIKDDPGVVKVWVDGVMDTAKYPHSFSMGTTTDRWSTLYFPSNWSQNVGWEHDNSNHIYLDEVEIYTDSSTGESTTGEMSNATITTDHRIFYRYGSSIVLQPDNQ